jgi:hypothetical protein
MKRTTELTAAENPPSVIAMQAEPFRLRDGSFRKGKGLQPGVKWQHLTALAYDGNCHHSNPCLE